MVIAFLVALATATVFLILYLEERRKDDFKIKPEQETVVSAPVQIPRPEENCAEQMRLTHELVKEAVRFNGYVPVNLSENLVGFKVDGENYCITTDRIPLMTIHKGYTIDKSEHDLDLMKRAAIEVSEGCMVGDVSLDRDGEGISFNIGTVECSYEHLCASLSYYLRIIQDLKDRHISTYHDMIKEKTATIQEQARYAIGEGCSNVVS